MRCCRRRKNRVTPSCGFYQTFDFIEARPRRFLRVLHANFSPPVSLFRKNENEPLELTSSDWATRRVGYEAPSLKRGGVSLVPCDWVLFFVHGVGGSADVWKSQFDFFKSQGFRVVAVDLLGHGMSSQPAVPSEYAFRQLAADLLAVFDQYADAKGNVLIGHSLGSSICTYIASKRPYAVAKLVLLCGGGPDVLNAGEASCCSVCDPIRLPGCCFRLCRPCCFSYAKRLMFSASHLKSNPVVHASVDDVSPQVVQSTLQGQSWPEGNEPLHRALRVDTQLLCGSADRLVSIEDEQRMFNALHFCRLDIVDDASHMALLETPLPVNSAIHDFLQQPLPITTDFVDFHISALLDTGLPMSDTHKKQVFHHQATTPPQYTENEKFPLTPQLVKIPIYPVYL